MPEFRRTWTDWAPGNLPETARYATDKTDKSPSVSFDSSIAPLVRPESPRRSGCLIASCGHLGQLVELGTGLTTRLCARHRRELYQHARERAEADDVGLSALLEQTPCRSCGRSVRPENDPCRLCAAAASPLVQFALHLGALPICACGATVELAGDTCPHCRNGDL